MQPLAIWFLFTVFLFVMALVSTAIENHTLPNDKIPDPPQPALDDLPPRRWFSVVCGLNPPVDLERVEASIYYCVSNCVARCRTKARKKFSFRFGRKSQAKLAEHGSATCEECSMACAELFAQLRDVPVDH